MAYEITSDCIACGSCTVVCPNGAVDDGYGSDYTGKGNSAAEGSSMGIPHYRLTDGCDGCGDCLEVCPTGAIIVET
ncbi:4Fe-4S binding protein [Metallumcola ferriviriculae]|uniref:Ferredoxin n=1 Tax=Metallumcola ferriviriculae TaxID=3039180 RepID=A0AAU0UL37_9FIRM|nr:4Fe-4S binding protein [Desulfitibacteraceae bacterium MK1]